MPKLNEERAQLSSGDNVRLTIMIPRASKEKLEELCQVHQEYAKKSLKLKPSSKSLMITKLIEREANRKANRKEILNVLNNL